MVSAKSPFHLKFSWESYEQVNISGVLTFIWQYWLIPGCESCRKCKAETKWHDFVQYHFHLSFSWIILSDTPMVLIMVVLLLWLQKSPKYSVKSVKRWCVCLKCTLVVLLVHYCRTRFHTVCQSSVYMGCWLTDHRQHQEWFDYTDKLSSTQALTVMPGSDEMISVQCWHDFVDADIFPSTFDKWAFKSDIIYWSSSLMTHKDTNDH